jgi:hypothetical protein
MSCILNSFLIGKGYISVPHETDFDLTFMIKIVIIHHKRFYLDLKVSHIHVYMAKLSKCQAGSDPETIDTGTIPSRYESILAHKTLLLGGSHKIFYDMDRDMLWHWDQVLKTHPNGMRFSCFGDEGELLATNEYFSVGGGFVVNEKTKGACSDCGGGYFKILFMAVDENMFYKSVDKRKVHGARLEKTHSVTVPLDNQVSAPSIGDPGSFVSTNEDTNHPPYPFTSGDTLLALTKQHNVVHLSSFICVLMGITMETDDYRPDRPRQ